MEAKTSLVNNMDVRVCVCIYIYMYVCVCVYIYIYIYIHSNREIVLDPKLNANSIIAK